MLPAGPITIDDRTYHLTYDATHEQAVIRSFEHGPVLVRLSTDLSPFEVTDIAAIISMVQCETLYVAD